jgi:3'-phosphoadenosine 5'-phosphosulfate sulfotransferase (PAPS reductase)/FAD synthetase
MNIHPEVVDFLSTQKHVTLGFSTGKDSVCTALILKELGVKFTPFFFYHIPDLEFVERNVAMYEKIFDTQIIRMPHPMLYDYLRHQDFQAPKATYYLDEMDFPKLTFEKLIDAHLESIGDPGGHYDAVGMRASESLNRRLVFKKQGFINHEHKKVYPICDWNAKDVLAYLKSKGVPLTEDYRIWNRSFDGLKYQFLFGVKQNYPKDWQTIKEYFPLIDLELFRYEKNIQYFQA